ncbi:hypothetical protein D3C81_2150050 [compost metagenome]
MDVGRRLVPAAVVIQAAHPQAKGEQPDEDQGHSPMQKNADQAEAGWGITPLHGKSPWKSRTGKTRSIKPSDKTIELKRNFSL